MIDATRTTTALLEGLHDDENAAAWTEFDTRYRPILIGFARKLGLGEADAADVAQETLVQFITEYRQGRYDRERGRLRSWLVGIARYRVAGVYRARAVKHAGRGTSAMVNLEDEAGLTRVWDEERRSALLREALNEVRTKSKTSDATIRAFELLVVRQMPVAAVASALGMTAHDVYLAKSRMAEKLRAILTRLEQAYDEGPP